MRQRKVKNLESKYKDYEDIIVYDPISFKDKWEEIMLSVGAETIGVEVGCGKGTFTAEMAYRHPEQLLIAIEGHRSVLLRAMEKVKARGLKNVIFVPEFITDITEWFDFGTVNAIYLNFSDPLPKPRTAKHRLTHRSKLRQYVKILKEDGELFFKTDNDDLFDFSIREILAENLEISDFTRDLHRSEFAENNIETEYEKKFSDLGENINYVRVTRGKSKSGEQENMAKCESMVAMNGRAVPEEDKIFGVSSRAKMASDKFGHEAVVNATVGTFLDDDGKVIVLSSVDEVVKTLEPEDYATYAPIAGTLGFKNAIKKAAFGSYEPKRFIASVASPGGTAALRNAIANYTCIGDKVLTHDWYWAPYKSIAQEQGRDIETFEMFNEEGGFNVDDFERCVKKLLRNQEHLLIMINTPANNPTGYSMSDEDFEEVVRIINSLNMEDKKITLLIDVAYIDFAGTPEETRTFLPIIEKLDDDVLILISYSTSKTFTFYGFRCAALICLAGYGSVADEFERVCAFSSRATWSNSPRAPQEIIDRIYSDENLVSRVDEERKGFRDMLFARGKAFEMAAEEAGLEILPFRAGFFVTVPCENPDELGARLEEEGIFVVPLAKGGIRVSIASISKEKCEKIPELIYTKMHSISNKQHDNLLKKKGCDAKNGRKN